MTNGDRDWLLTAYKVGVITLHELRELLMNAAEEPAVDCGGYGLKVVPGL